MGFDSGDPFRRDEIERARQRRERLHVEAPKVEADVAKLSRLEANGWKLDADDDLDAIERHAERVASVYFPMGLDSRARELVSGAKRAVRQERARRKLEAARAVERQRDRLEYVARAAGLIEDAAKRLEWADSIEDRHDLVPFGSDDAAQSARWHHIAEVLATVGGAQFQRYAEVAEAMAAEFAD